MQDSYVCVTCGTQYAPSAAPPKRCPICEDERQYIGAYGQQWIAFSELQRRYRNIFFQEGIGLWGILTEPKFGIGQRAILVQAGKRNVLWDCVSLVNPDTVEIVRSLGGLAAIAISHPHYYSSMMEWSHAFGGIPVYIHSDDRQWVQRPDAAICFWNGETHVLEESLTLIRVGGHFAGYQVLHWASGENGGGALLTGDMPQVCPDRRYVSFMYSYPNLIPLNGETVRRIVRVLEPYRFQRLYGAWPGLVVEGDPKQALRRSAERYLRAIGDLTPLNF